MAKWKIYTPDGVQDILFEECYLKRNIEAKLRELFRGNACFEVETPTMEFYDAIASDKALPQETMFKFFDQQGRILVLRPDITIPIARLAATKCRELGYPLRFSYIGNVFRYNDFGGGKQNEFTQTGVEILGTNTPESDAEVIAIAINAMKAAGLENFQVDIGQVEFFEGLMEETGLSRESIGQMRVLTESKDFVGVGELLDGCDIREDLKKLIFDLPGLFGSTDVIDRVEAMNVNRRSQEALENIRRVLGILEDYGLSNYVSVDLGMLRGLDYDTGIIFRGFTHGVGFPVMTGGRYDRLVGEFGMECPATGFSLGVNLVMMALQRQKAAYDKPGVDSIVCYEAKGRKAALQLCGELRRQGLAVELDVSHDGIETVKEHAAARNIGGVINIVDDDAVEIHYLETGEVRRVSAGELLRGAGV